MARLVLAITLFAGCSHFQETETEETVTLTMPVWPPQTQTDSPDSQEYPPLSRWKITISKSEGSTVFHAAPDTTLEITVPQKFPFSVQAEPVTLLKDGSECLYFHPAGFVYPQSSQEKPTWEQGYAAFIMEGLYRNCRQNGLSASDAARYVSTFNWQKFISTTQEKTNPWLCDSARIIKNLSEGTFRASLLSPSACHQLSREKILEETGLSVLSSYIPENQTIKNTGQIIIKKDTPLLLSDIKEFGVFITYLSEKKVQIEYIYIPIYKIEI